MASFYIRQLKYFCTRIRYKILGYKIGKYFIVGKGVNIDKHGFYAGDCVYIGQYSYIGPKVEIGNFVLISDNVNFVGYDHDYDKPGIPIILAGRPINEPKTIVEDDVWIGHGVTIIRGIKVGEGSIIGANSVVTKDVEPYSIVAGIPAKEIRKRFTPEEQIKHSNFLKSYRDGELILLHDRKPIFKRIKND